VVTKGHTWLSHACSLFVGKPEGKRPLAKRRRRWVDNIKMGLVEIGLSCVDWIGQVQDWENWRALVNSDVSHSISSQRPLVASYG
jgi:hypothetical protein